MRIVVAIGLVAACSAPPGTSLGHRADTPPLVIGRPAIRIDETLETERMTTRSMVAGGARVEVRVHRRTRWTVLAIDGGRASKMRTSYVEDKYLHNNKPTARPPLAGQTFIVEMIDGDVQVSEEGGTITDAERVAVRDDHDRFGVPDGPLEVAVYERAWRAGVPVEVDTSDPWQDIDSGTMTLTLVDRTPASTARFTLVGRAKSGELSVVSTGEMEIDLRDPRLGSNRARIELRTAAGELNVSNERTITRLVTR